MNSEEIVLDLETQNTFEDVGEHNPGLLKISIVGTYFYHRNEYRVFEEHELGELEFELSKCSLLIGFNHIRFDLPVLEPYLKQLKIKNLPCLDILECIRRVAGHRVSLNSVAKATLNTKKSGHGLDAIKYWREGNLKELKKYCLDDVKITKEIYDFGREKGEIFFTARDPKYKSRVPVSWNNLIEPQPKQLGLF